VVPWWPSTLCDCCYITADRSSFRLLFYGPCRHIQTCGGAFVKTAEPEKASRAKGKAGGEKGLKGPGAGAGAGPGPGSPAKVSIADMFRRRAEGLALKREPRSSQGEPEGKKESGDGGRLASRVKIEGEERSKGKRQRKKGGQGQNAGRGESGAQEFKRGSQGGSGSGERETRRVLEGGSKE